MMKLLNANVSLICIFIFFAVFYILLETKIEWFADYLNIYKKPNIENILNTLIGSLASLSGLLIAVLLLSFEFLKQKIERIAIVYFLKNYWVQGLISTFLSAVFICLFTSIYISNKEVYMNNDLNLIYYSLIMFSLCLLGFFPLSFLILKSLTPKEIIRQEINRLSINNAIFINKSTDSFNLISEYDKLPIEILSVLNNKLVHLGDQFLPQLIVIEVSKKYKNFFIHEKSENNRKQLLHTINGKIYIKSMNEAIVSGNYYVLIKTINCIKEFQDEVNKKGISIALESLKFFHKNFYKKALERCLNKDCFIVIQEVMKNINLEFDFLKNLDENKILGLSKNTGKYNEEISKTTEVWKVFRDNYIELYECILEYAVQENNLKLFNQCCRMLINLRSDFLNKQVDFLIEQYFYLYLSNMLTRYNYLIIENKYHINSILELEGFFLDMIITHEKKKYGRQALEIYCEFILQLEFKKILNYRNIGSLKLGSKGLDNGLSFIGKRCAINFYEDDLIKNCLFDIVNTWKSLKESLEKELEFRSQDYQIIKDSLESIKYWHKKNEKSDRKLVIKINKILRNFQDF